jgi:hypothetical protein
MYLFDVVVLLLCCYVAEESVEVVGVDLTRWLRKPQRGRGSLGSRGYMGKRRRQSVTTLLPIEPLKSRKAKTFVYDECLTALA